jgi:hypothetical protein
VVEKRVRTAFEEALAQAGAVAAAVEGEIAHQVRLSFRVA